MHMKSTNSVQSIITTTNWVALESPDVTDRGLGHWRSVELTGHQNIALEIVSLTRPSIAWTWADHEHDLKQIMFLGPIKLKSYGKETWAI